MSQSRAADSQMRGGCLAAALGCLTLLTCLAGLAIGSLAALWLERRPRLALDSPTPTVLAHAATATFTPTTAPQAATITPGAPFPSPTPTAKPEQLFDLQPPGQVNQRPAADRAAADLARLMAVSFPPRDYYEAASRLSGRDLGPRTVNPGPYEIDDTQSFITDRGRVQAELLAATDHVYYWVESGQALNRADLAAAARRFEEDYYPGVTALFGQEWKPGMDNDARFSVLLLASFSDDTKLGYFDSGDEYPRSVNRTSNEQEIVYLNMELLTVGEPLYFGTLVHELQHLIHWYLDHNEATWLDEGLAQMTETVVGLATVDTVVDYLRRPDTQLNTWNYDDDDVVYAHYGASYLFAMYLWDQLGEAAVKELARHPTDGMPAVQAVLRGYRPDTSLEQFVADWAAANYLNDAAAGSQYAYTTISPGRPSVETRISDAPFELVETVSQFGVDYVELNVSGDMVLSFAGDTFVAAAAEPRSGEQMWLAPAVDNLNAKLTNQFDLTGLSQATLTFWAWYELEEGWDFAYVSASMDRGATWELLPLRNARAGEYGPAFTGESRSVAGNVNGWVSESVSLNRYLGHDEVLVRFELLTDSAVLERGFAVDDISVPELGYVHDVEGDLDGWQADGFLPVGWQLPQQWMVQLIQTSADGLTPQVISLPLDGRNQGQWTIDPGPEGGVLVITALTPFTTAEATYWLSVQP